MHGCSSHRKHQISAVHMVFRAGVLNPTGLMEGDHPAHNAAEYLVNFVPKNAVPRHDGAVQATTGEFAGWWTWTRDNYEVHNGPFWHREENGAVRCVFRVEQKHINGGGAVHGGCLMTFADYCLFAIANTVLEEGRGVTLSFATEFIDAVYKDELVEGTGEVVRAGRSIIFMRGTLKAGGRPVLSFSGTVKRVTAARTTE
jgi:uncharacterized protein (TIGR00369 family)